MPENLSTLPEDRGNARKKPAHEIQEDALRFLRAKKQIPSPEGAQARMKRDQAEASTELSQALASIEPQRPKIEITPGTDTVRIKAYEDSIAVLIKNVSSINAQYSDKTGLIGKTQDWIGEKTGAWGSAEVIYKDAVARQSREAEHLYKLLLADAHKMGPEATNKLIGVLSAALPSLKLAPVSLADATVRSGKTAMHTANGLVEGVYSSLEGVVTGTIDLAKFMYSYSESWIGDDPSYKKKIDEQVGQIWNYINTTHHSKAWKDVGEILKKEMIRINKLPESERAFAIGNLGGRVIGMLAVLKAGVAVAGKVSEMGGKAVQARRIGEKLIEKGQEGSARAGRVAELGRKATQLQYSARSLDVIMNGIAESTLGLALVASLKNIKLVLISTTASKGEKLKAIDAGIQQAGADVKSATTPEQREAITEVQNALEAERKKITEGAPEGARETRVQREVPGRAGTVGRRGVAANDGFVAENVTPLSRPIEVAQAPEVRMVANGTPIQVQGANPHEVRASLVADTTDSGIRRGMASANLYGTDRLERPRSPTPDSRMGRGVSESLPNLNRHNLQVGSEITKDGRTIQVDYIAEGVIRFKGNTTVYNLESINHQIDRGATLRHPERGGIERGNIPKNTYNLEPGSTLTAKGSTITVTRVEGGLIYFKEREPLPLASMNNGIETGIVTVKHPSKKTPEGIKPEPLPDFTQEYAHLSKYDAKKYYDNIKLIDHRIDESKRKIESARSAIEHYGTDTWKDSQFGQEQYKRAQSLLRENTARMEYLEKLKGDLKDTHERVRREEFAAIETARQAKVLEEKTIQEINMVGTNGDYAFRKSLKEHESTLSGIRTPDQRGIGNIDPSDITKLRGLSTTLEQEIALIRNQQEMLLAKYGTPSSPNIEEALRETRRMLDTRIQNLEAIRLRSDEALRLFQVAQDARDRLLQSTREATAMRGSPENIARLESELAKKRAELESIKAGLSREETALRIERTGIENGLPTAQVFEGGLDRGRNYSISASELANNRRINEPIIEGLERQITTLEESLREARVIQQNLN